MTTTPRRCTEHFAEVRSAELERIEAIRKTRAGQDKYGAAAKDAPLTGLTLSGGGIRSAAFGLGMLQSLQNRGILRHIDYLSTVSGGGYIGASLSYLLVEGTIEGRPTGLPSPVAAATTSGAGPAPRFPLGTRRVGAKTSNPAPNRYLDHIRGHGNYITQGDRLGVGSVVAMVLRSIALGLVIWLPLAALLSAVLLVAFDENLRHAATLGAPLALAAIAAYAIWLCVRPDAQDAEADYNERLRQQVWLGNILKVAGVLLLVGSLPFAAGLRDVSGEALVATLAGISSSLGGIAAAAGFFRPERSAPATRIDWLDILASCGAALMLYGALLLAFMAAQELLAWNKAWGVGLLVAAAALAGIIAHRTDLNMIALHRLYRDRLMETFLPDPDRAGHWHPAEAAEKFWLKDVSPASGIAPYHLVNSHVILTRSKVTGYSGRGGDSFVLSPLFCGSDATGWCPTEQWISFRSRDPTKDTDYLTLATAMAISAAAVNPNAASAGKGPTRSRLVSLAMNLLNLRLSCWLPNPRRRLADEPGETPKPTWGRLAREIALGLFEWRRGIRHEFEWRRGIRHEEAELVELSDGGHFENLGLYELIRRRVKVVVVSDGGCDPTFGFADLGNAIERCRVDFGVDIRFHDAAHGLDRLIPLAHGKPAVDGSFPFAESGVAVARIRYPANAEEKEAFGHLLYVKSTLTRNLPADVYAYKLANPTFPDQTTSDQWFDEAQFEAYRELGYGLIEGFIDAFVRAAPSGAADRPGSDPFGYGELVDWLRGRPFAVVQ